MDINTIIEACYSLYNERLEHRKALVTNDEINIWQRNTLNHFRVQLEPYIFNYLNYKYSHKLDEFWEGHQFPKNSKYAFVIIERRIHPNWWFILRNIAWAAPHFSLYIFCSDINYDFIISLLGNKAPNVNICKWFKGVGDKDQGFKELNITCKLSKFYKLIDAEYYINIQMDSYFLQKIPDWIFTGTYYGSPWGWNPSMAGNGGLSIRHLKGMIEICEKEIDKGINNILEDVAEDWFFSNAILNYNYELPSLNFRINVFQENFPTNVIPIGTHQFWTYIMNYNIDNKELFIYNIQKLITIIDIN